ncbi:MAG: 4-hydroxyproline epimerase [Gammaproteobacteria bacterium]|nr:4-hydroxyproline epimerase [Gammaproteobacteria bacterium]
MTQHTFFCIDGHTAGMPVRMVIGGVPPIAGVNQSERRQTFIREFDWIRQSLMYEPRGHSVMSGSILMPPTSDDYDMSLIYIETSGCLPMCGHGTIGSVTFALEHGLVSPETPGVVRVETPAGLIEARYQRNENKVASIRFTNVPSFLLYKDHEFDCPEFGKLKADIAYGGNFYPIIEPQENFTDASDYSPEELRRIGVQVFKQLNDELEIVHPEDPSIHDARHCMWTGKPTVDGADSKNVVIAGEFLVDRSPCGTGTSARVAQRHAKGLLNQDEAFVHESVIGSLFTGRVEDTTRVGEHDAIFPSIEGQAFVTGLNTLFVDSDDPFATGFML